ncbi:exopolysaccharide biosynthesis polyprenyl glycosylphosphotransferase [Veillonella criceti]|uniref:exopolysaccharide biosynthesis polyprenyl glycosylphosphotransferase n=1 Tax=Veillonella criceti TaxID=103891 RepID=UPI002481D665|nr:exopolysaccharide biosynthesis polyprenyl glycosylphosphotransferase [Veillonella criceti]
MKLLNVLLITLPFGFIWMQFYSNAIYESFYFWGNWAVIALFVLCYIIFSRIYHVYNISFSSISEIFYSELLALFFTNIIMFCIIVLLMRSMPNLLPQAISIIFEIFIAYAWAYSAYTWYFNHNGVNRTLILYDEHYKKDNLYKQLQSLRAFNVEGEMNIHSAIDNGLGLLKNVNSVILCDVHSHERNKVLKYCIEHNIYVFVLPRIGDVLMTSLEPIHLLHLPVWKGCRYSPALEFTFFKRIFDIVSSGIVLLLASPIMLITGYLIHKTDGGPVFYRQCRLTKDGKKFDVLKFRSMRVDAEKDGVARLSTGEKDDRITPIGRFIRKCRIDELPQLINIIKGDMSVVGPRPERPEIAAQYEKFLPEFSLRLQAKAGLTGLAQVYGKYNTTPYDKLQMDLMYIARPSLIEDLRIIFATIKILFVAESTEGFEVMRDSKDEK